LVGKWENILSKMNIYIFNVLTNIKIPFSRVWREKQGKSKSKSKERRGRRRGAGPGDRT